MGGFLANAWDWFVFILLFGITIFIHELGHFLVGLWTGMVVETFSIGFGPAIWKRKFRGVTFKIGCIPLGGYVSLPQLDPASMTRIQNGKQDNDNERRILAPVSPWKKVCVVVAGGVGNMVFAVIAAWIIFLSPFQPDAAHGTKIGYVMTNSMAYASGIRQGDVIVAVNGKHVSTWYDYTVECMLGKGKGEEVTLTVRSNEGERNIVLPVADQGGGYHIIEGIGKSSECVIMEILPDSPAASAGLRTNDVVRSFAGVDVAGPGHFVLLVADQGERETSLLVERGGTNVELRITPKYDEKLGRTIIGVRPGEKGLAPSPWMHHKNPWLQVKSDVLRIKRFLFALVTPGEARPAAQGLGGPVMVFLGLWAAIKQSMLNAVGFVRFLNVNLAILNLLPLPVLDGGHVIFALWESVTRRRVPARFANALVNVFAALLIILFITLTYRDIGRVRAWKKLKNAASAVQQDAPTNRLQNSSQNGERR